MNSEDNMNLEKIDAEMKKNIDARTKEFREKLAKLTYEKIKAKLVPSKEPLKGYPHNESIDESVAKAVQGLNDLGNKMKGRDQKDVRRIEKLYRSGNTKVFQGAIRALDTDLRDQVKDIFDALGMVKQGVIESVDLNENNPAWQDDIDYLKKLDKTDPKKAAAFRKRTKALKKGGGWNLAGKPTPEQKKIMQQMDRDAKKKHPALYKKEDLEVAESLDLDEGKMKEFHDYAKEGKSAQWIAKKMGLDMKTVKELIKDMDESTLDEFGSRGMSAAQKDNLRRSIKNRQKGKREEVDESDEATKMLSVSDMSERVMTLKQIAQKHKGLINKAQRSGNAEDLKQAEKDLLAWAMKHNEVSGKDPDEEDDWLSNVVSDKKQFDALLKFAKD